MIVGRIIGWLLIVLAVATAGHEAITSLDAGAYVSLAFGALWARTPLPARIEATAAGAVNRRQRTPRKSTGTSVV